MIPGNLAAVTDIYQVPRTCGDDPYYIDAMTPDNASAPHLRG